MRPSPQRYAYRPVFPSYLFCHNGLISTLRFGLKVYDIFDVVTEVELKSISIQPFMSASSFAERRGLMPERRSEWVNQHIKNLFSVDRTGKLDKAALYVWHMSLTNWHSIDARHRATGNWSLSFRVCWHSEMRVKACSTNLGPIIKPDAILLKIGSNLFQNYSRTVCSRGSPKSLGGTNRTCSSFCFLSGLF